MMTIRIGRGVVLQIALLLAVSSTPISARADDTTLLGTAGQLAFVDTSESLVVLDGHTGTRQRIVGPPLFRAAGPVWSPDGKSIAVVGNEIVDQPDGMHGLYVVSASGGEPRGHRAFRNGFTALRQHLYIGRYGEPYRASVANVAESPPRASAQPNLNLC